MNWIKKHAAGLLLCLGISVPASLFGHFVPVVGAPICAILLGMAMAAVLRTRSRYDAGIAFTSKKLLQAAVVLLGFGMNLSTVARTGARSLPVIGTTIGISLLIAFALYKLLRTPARITTLIGVGSSICGGSAIAATAPVIGADDEEIAQAISVIFLFNVIAALLFPSLGGWLGLTNEGFGLFAGTAVNDTSSVTAAAAAWDVMHGANTLEAAAVVKMTRTLAILPITLVLALMRTHQERKGAVGVEAGVGGTAGGETVAKGSVGEVSDLGGTAGGETVAKGAVGKKPDGKGSGRVPFRKIFPFFILYFLAASLVTTVCTWLGVPAAVFLPLRSLSRFLIVMAMAAIGLNTQLGKLVKGGGASLLIGLSCWIGITGMSLLMQKLQGLW